MSKNNFNNNFNPSPFNDKNKEDLDEVLKECEIKNRELQDTLQQLYHYLLIHKEQQKSGTKFINQKLPNWPLVFLARKESHTHVFTAMLERKNKDMILAFAYDWLKRHEIMNPNITCDDFIQDFWQQNFENKLI